MSDAVNPYQSPESAAVPAIPLTAQGALTETMLIYLKEASPWLRFIGILGFISSGTTVLWGIVSIALMPLFRQVWTEMPPSYQPFSGIARAAFGGTMVIFGIGAGMLLFFPSLFIYRFGEKIRSYLRSGTAQDLELAFKNNKSLWKFFGVICIINLVFIPLMLIGGIILGVVAVLS
jgi:hypothetical protein